MMPQSQGQRGAGEGERHPETELESGQAVRPALAGSEAEGTLVRAVTMSCTCAGGRLLTQRGGGSAALAP
jgi:hypothetical protein